MIYIHNQVTDGIDEVLTITNKTHKRVTIHLDKFYIPLYTLNTVRRSMRFKGLRERNSICDNLVIFCHFAHSNHVWNKSVNTDDINTDMCLTPIGGEMSCSMWVDYFFLYNLDNKLFWIRWYGLRFRDGPNPLLTKRAAKPVVTGPQCGSASLSEYIKEM